ncbi:COG1086 Predicted nucleoside-diphosphate sugar epimerases [actinobacterium SCGC AAA044-D11]
MSKNLKSSVVTITGGTGSFGSTMVKDLIKQDAAEIRIFSRDENKQDSMRNSIKDERVRFFIGDVRDASSVENVMKGTEYVFHAAALKQVPSCEFFPMQASLTNVTGSSNVLDAAIKAGVKSVVCLSTDKAVYPINAMGMSKALMEKVAQSYARNIGSGSTKVAITRYGNVLMSRGSVIPLFLDQIKNGQPVTITDGTMTRFLMSLSDSVELVKYAFTNANSGDLFVKKAPGCTVDVLVEALSKIAGKSGKVEIKNIGIRHGEKMSEVLLGSEERARATDLGDFFQVPLDTRSLDYHVYFDKGQEQSKEIEPYTSSNTKQLSVDEVVDLVSKLPEYIEYRKGQ